MTLFTRTWGDATKPPVVCVHGLTRNSLDFATLGETLASDFYVLAPDIPGRGQTPPLADSAQYHNAYYAELILAWANERNISQVRWVGTSMGGMIAMVANAMQPQFISKLVLNDVGAVIPKVAIDRLKTYVGMPLVWPTREAAEMALRQIYVGFGITEEKDWQHFFASTLIEAPGGWRMNYDLRIAENMQQLPNENLNLWPLVEQLNMPILLLRGESSDLLLKETAVEMVTKKFNIHLVEIQGCGHAPALQTSEQTQLIREFLKT